VTKMTGASRGRQRRLVCASGSGARGCRSSTRRSGELGSAERGRRAVEEWIFHWNFIYCITAHFTMKDSKWRTSEGKMEIPSEIALDRFDSFRYTKQ
jgi:hypothetical protein